MKTKIAVLTASLGVASLAGLAYAATDSNPDPAPAAVAGASGAPGAPGFGFKAHIAGKLGLSADQQKSIDALLAQGRSEIQALRDDTSLTPEARREKAHAIMKNYREQIHAVLTPEQQKQADELRAKVRNRAESFAERRGHGREGRDFRGPGMRPEFGRGPHREFGRESGRDAGRNPMAIIAMADRIKDHVADELKLTDEQRDKLDHMARAFREEQKVAAQKHREEMRAVLTPGQQKQFDEMRQHMRRGNGAGGPPPMIGMNDAPDEGMDGMGVPPPPLPEID